MSWPSSAVRNSTVNLISSRGSSTSMNGTQSRREDTKMSAQGPPTTMKQQQSRVDMNKQNGSGKLEAKWPRTRHRSFRVPSMNTYVQVHDTCCCISTCSLMCCCSSRSCCVNTWIVIHDNGLSIWLFLCSWNVRHVCQPTQENKTCKSKDQRKNNEHLWDLKWYPHRNLSVKSKMSGPRRSRSAKRDVSFGKCHQDLLIPPMLLQLCWTFQAKPWEIWVGYWGVFWSRYLLESEILQFLPNACDLHWCGPEAIKFCMKDVWLFQLPDATRFHVQLSCLYAALSQLWNLSSKRSGG